MVEPYPKQNDRATKDNYNTIYQNIYRNFRKSSINIAASSSDRQIIPLASTPTQILEKLSLLILKSLHQENYLETLLLLIRQELKADRVLICRLKTDGSGTIVAESVASGLPQALNYQIDDPCCHHNLEQHHSGIVHATNNIYEAGLTDDYIKTLEQFAVKANLASPIINDNKVLGLLMAHQCSQERFWQAAEIELFGQIATQLGFALGYTVLLEQRQKADLQAQIVTDTTQLIRRCLKVKDILNTTVTQVRQALQADRVIVYRFQNDWSGTVAAESIAPGYPQALNHQIDDSYFRERYAQLYRTGDVCAIANIYKAGLTPYHISSLERFAVKSKLITPIVKDRKLFGLLIAHQCLSFRSWEESDINLCIQIATQVGFAIEQTQLREKLEQITQIATQDFEIEPLWDEQIPTEVEILPEENDYDATVTFIEHPLQ